jgi:FkbM family methyltransferase
MRATGSLRLNSSWIEAKQDLVRWAWLRKIRPQPVAVLVADLIAGKNRRRLLETPGGIKLYLDPLTQLGATLLQTDTYEPDTEAIFRKWIRPGFTVLDVGANEGYFSILAAQLVGPDGHVIAVEPQTRCVEIIRRNLLANSAGNCSIVEAALGPSDSSAKILLMPALNTGASSLVRKYRWSNQWTPVRMLGASTLLRETGATRFDFVKLDVEGYEPEVVCGLLPLINAGRIGIILIDFHHSILKQRGMNAADIRKKLIDAGMAQTGEKARQYELYNF